jgi:hypothetical protein
MQELLCSIDGLSPGYGQPDGLIGLYRNPDMFRSLGFDDCYRPDRGDFNDSGTHINPGIGIFLQT